MTLVSLAFLCSSAYQLTGSLSGNAELKRQAITGPLRIKRQLKSNVQHQAARSNFRMGVTDEAGKPASGGEEELPLDEQRRLDGMRARLEGLFGTVDEEVGYGQSGDFDGAALRQAIFDRWGVQYDVQPQKRHGRVYIQVMWRYFEQQSFYMDEDEFASHCEAVAILLTRWNAVNYFLDYITTIKKRRTYYDTYTLDFAKFS